MAKRRELTTTEKQITERLKKIWVVKKIELKLTQESVGLACGWSGQAAFDQYINGRVPLNIEAVLRLSKVFKIHPAEIMPEIKSILPSKNMVNNIEDKEIAGTAQELGGMSAEALEFARLFDELPSNQRAVLGDTAKAFMDSVKKQTDRRKLDSDREPERRKSA